MLSNERKLHLFINQNIPLVGRKLVERIRTSEPVRRVGGGTHNVVTRFASKKMGCVIQAESHKGELPRLYRWEHDPATHEFYDQPSQVKLSYKSASGKKTTHLSTPDFFLIQEAWMGWIECKPLAELEKSYQSGCDRFIPDGHGGWRCPPGETFAAKYGLGFQVLANEDTNWMLVRNLEFLSDYLSPDCPVPDIDVQHAIRSAFGAERWTLLASLLNSEGVTADSLYSLIAWGKLFFDIEHEILAEPIFTNICRDELSYQVYRGEKFGRRNQAAVALPKIVLRAGTQIIWDGQPWRILNVGKNEIFLEDEHKAISNIEPDVFHSLVEQGAIRGIPEKEDQQHELASEVVRHAAPIDLEKAVTRCNYLDGPAQSVATIRPRTLRYWRRRAEDGEIAYGNRFAGLVTRISARGNRQRKVCQRVIEIMNEVIETEVMSPFQTKISACYGMVRNQCLADGLEIPSGKTFRTEIKRRREEALALARQGRKASYPLTEFQWRIDQSTPRHGERPFEIGHIDHTELDIELVDSRSGANLGRPWLTVLLDANTRVVLAFFLTFDPPSYRSCMAVIRECVRRHGRIPKTIVVDQGSDFESLYFEALLARLETHKKSRPAAKSRFGSVIERFFGVNNQMLVHNLAGNSQALQRPRSMSPSHDPRKLAIWTLPALTEAMDDYFGNTYASMLHPALGVSPKDAMANGLATSGMRGHILIPYSDEFIRLTMPSTPAGKATIRTGRGVKIRGIHYWHPALREPKYVNTKVPVLYDPFDVSRAYALVGGEWVLCRSEQMALFERRTEREIATISQEIRAIHHQADIHRNVNAGDIAVFISKTRETEAVLRQQRHDAENPAYEVLPEPSLPHALPNDTTVTQTSPWSTPVVYEQFEELK